MADESQGGSRPANAHVTLDVGRVSSPGQLDVGLGHNFATT